MHAYGLARLGRDAELRKTPNGDSVASLSLAFAWGRKGDDGKRQVCWVDGALWGKRAEALAPYLIKGGLVAVTLEDMHIETYQGKNGEGHKLAARVIDVELAGGGEQRQSAAPAQQQPRQQPALRQQPAPSGGGFEDMDDSSIPF